MKSYVDAHDMKINSEKCGLMLYNFSRKKFEPSLRYDGRELKVIEKTKLLGVQCSVDGKWTDHINYIAEKGRRRLYFLRRLKDLGASETTLKDLYILFVRSVLETSAPLWTGALLHNKKLSATLSRVQNSALRIIRPDLDSMSAATVLGIGPLEQHRLKISIKCAKQMSEDPRFSYLFPMNTNSIQLRNTKRFKEVSWRKTRLGYSAIPFFQKLLNAQS